MREQAQDLTDRLRNQLIGALHIGDVAAGQRLPSIREVARRLGENERRVARAYRTLETEGLVEVRGRSGVYAASMPRVGNGLLEETAEWLAAVLLDGWVRRVPIALLPELISRYSTRRQLKVALVDSCADAIEAFRHELEADFGLHVAPVWLDTPPAARGTAERLPAELRAADLVVTTIFGATQARVLAERVGRPMITVRVHPEMSAAVIARLEQGRLTVVCADAEFGERIRMQYQGHVQAPDQIRIVLADDARGLAEVDPSDPVMFTRAARKRAPDYRPRMLFQHSPTLSPDSARALLRFIVRAHSAVETEGSSSTASG